MAVHQRFAGDPTQLAIPLSWRRFWRVTLRVPRIENCADRKHAQKRIV